MIDKEISWEKIKILYRALTNRGGWYIGLSIKKYINKEIFGLQKNFRNSAISSRRWSAYCHYSEIITFKNLLDKHHIEYDDTVLIHPLCPVDFVDEVIARGYKVTSLDIQKTDCNFDPKTLISFLKDAKSKGSAPSLVVFYSTTGLYENIKKSVEEIQKLTIPSLVIIDNPSLNISLLELFDTLTLGSVIWNVGDSFLDEQLNQVLDDPLPSQNWYLSWFLETRTRSSLEYHLSDSQDTFEPVLQSFFYLLLSKYKEFFWGSHIYLFLANRILLQNFFKNKAQAMTELILAYKNVLKSAIPDVIFDLQLKFPQKYPKDNIELIHHSSDLQQRAKEIYDLFLQKISSRSVGSLEIPDFYLDRTYLEYFVFTTEHEYWMKELDSLGLKCSTFTKMHDIFLSQNTLVQANFINKYGLRVKI